MSVVNTLNDLDVSKEELKELYYRNFSHWAEINLKLLKEKQYDLVDWDNLFEELEDMARSDLKACISHLTVILEHLYKLDNFKDLAGGETAGKGWIKSINNSRRRIKGILEDNPKLKTELPNQLQKAWKEAVLNLQEWLEKNDYNLNEFTFPKQCSYTYEEAMTRDLEENSNNPFPRR